MKIYTKRGDSGETDLFGGARVLKNHVRVKAYGDIDGAMTAVGLAYSAPDISAAVKAMLVPVMELLFVAGAEIATAQKENAQQLLDRSLSAKIADKHVLDLECSIDEMEKELSPLKSFILPCGSDGAARLHGARIMVRKAEVALLDLLETHEPVRPEIIKFFNRLSDFLFVLARKANKDAAVTEIPWRGIP